MRRRLAEDERTAAFERALELLDLTLADPRWRGRLRELARAREVLCDAADGGREYGATLADLDRYFLDFALLARRGR
jgi:acyl-CoA hydrolase